MRIIKISCIIVNVLILVGFVTYPMRSTYSACIMDNLSKAKASELIFISGCQPGDEIIKGIYERGGITFIPRVDPAIIKIKYELSNFPFIINLIYDGGGMNSYGYRCVLLQWYGYKIFIFSKPWIS